MSNALALKIEAAARATVPAGLTAVLMLLGSIPVKGLHVQVLEPVLAFASIYYWTLYRPDLMPAALVFALGLLYDVLSGAPVGAHAAMLVVAHAVLTRQRRFLIDKTFILNWVGFAVLAAGGCVLIWLAASVFYSAPVDPWGLLFQTLMTIVAYPLVFRLLLHCHLSLVQPG
jgi:rod shape-determining protein MreD